MRGKSVIFMMHGVPPNDAGQWRAANGAQHETDVRLARPLEQAG
jgi:hypothetical protein